MTPLAHKIALDSCLPRGQRVCAAATHALLDDTHFFECSEVVDAARDLAEEMLERGHLADRLAFLPAPRTWLEWRLPVGGRAAVLLSASEDGSHATCTMVSDIHGAVENFSNAGTILLGSGNASLACPVISVDEYVSEAALSDQAVAVAHRLETTFTGIVYGLLAMINSPRVIGRRQHVPHAGLQRKIAAARGLPGKYPLHAWNEIVLKVQAPRDESGNPPRESWLSGSRALHFVRAHLRIRRGSLEHVQAHWRGNPALGMKKTRYRMAAA